MAKAFIYNQVVREPLPLKQEDVSVSSPNVVTQPVRFANAIIEGRSTVVLSSIDIAARGWTQSSVFAITDLDTVEWSAGVFTSANGITYTIGAGNTGNMSAKTYIYLDISVSTTAYQTTTTASSAVGAGKVLIATAQNGTVEPIFFVLSGAGGQNIDATSIVANSITANELATSIVYAGSIVIDTAGLIRSGQTAYATGTGWWIGNDGGTPKLSIGNSTYYFRWDGANTKVRTVSPVSFYLNSKIEGSDMVIYSDDEAYIPSHDTTSTFEMAAAGGRYQLRNTTSEWADADSVRGLVKLGSFAYALVEDTGATPDEFRIYRYAKDDLASGGTVMTFSGTPPDLTTDVALKFTSDGTFIYINFDGGNSANAYVLAKYSVSGTVLTYVSSITCGSATLGFADSFHVLSSGNIYTLDPVTNSMSKFNSSGTLQYTDATDTISSASNALHNFEDQLYMFDVATHIFSKLYYTN